MSPSEKEFGELIEQVRGLAKSVDLMRAENQTMRAENAADHENVARRLDAIDEKLDKKADNERVNDHAKRLNAIEISGAKSSVTDAIFSFLLRAAAVAAITGLIGLLITSIGGG